MIWGLIAAVVVVVLAAVLWPLLRSPRVIKDRAAYDMEVFQDQLKEIERDVARGVLTETEAASARLEIQRRILTAGRTVAETHRTSTRGKRIAIASSVGILAPALALGVYLSVGAPDLATREAVQARGPAVTDQDMQAVVNQLAEKVAQDPNNMEGLTLLARSYRDMQEWEKSAATYAKLLVLRPDVETYASYGEMLIAQAQGQVTPEAHDALTKALELDREEPRSRFYLGLEQSQQNNPRDAIAIWRDLTNTAPQDAPWQAMVQRQMAQVAQNAGIPPMSVEPRHPLSPAAAPTATASAPPPAVAPTPTMDQRFTPEQRQMVEGMVGGLAARLEQNPNDFKGWMLLGRSYSVMEKWDDAAKAYDKAVALEPTNAEPKLQLMGVLMATVNPDAPEPMPARVVTVANDILKIHSAQADALFALGLARAKAGDKAGARDFWQRAEKSAGPELKDSIAQRMKALN